MPGVRSVDPDAERLLRADARLLELVGRAVAELSAEFEGGQIEIESFIEPDSIETDEVLYVTVYSGAGDRLERLRRARRNWRARNPSAESAPVCLTAHGR